MILHIGDVLMQQKWHYFMNTLEMQQLLARSFCSQKLEKYLDTLKEEERERINECEVKSPELISENLDQIPNN